MASPYDKILSTRSYVVLVTQNSSMNRIWAEYLPAPNVRLAQTTSVSDALLAPKRVHHLLGIVVDLETVKFPEADLTRLENQGVSVTLYQDGSFRRRERAVAAPTLDTTIAGRVFSELIAEPLPREIRDVWVFALNTTHKNIFPDISCTLADRSRPTSKANLWVSCQLNGKGFLASLGIGMDVDLFRKQNQFYASLDPSLIEDSLSEMANQVQGIMSYNLSRSDLDGRIDLPTLIDDRSMMVSSSCIRSTFYMPQGSAHDELGLYTVDYGFMTTREGPRLREIAEILAQGPAMPTVVEFFD